MRISKQHQEAQIGIVAVLLTTILLAIGLSILKVFKIHGFFATKQNLFYCYLRHIIEYSLGL